MKNTITVRGFLTFIVTCVVCLAIGDKVLQIETFAYVAAWGAISMTISESAAEFVQRKETHHE